MTSAPQSHRPDDLTARIIVAVGGGLLIFVIALVGFAVSATWIPGLLVLALIPVHLVLAITDTTVLDDPKNAGSRAIAELRRLAGGGVRGSGFGGPASSPPPPMPPMPPGGAGDPGGAWGPGSWPSAPAPPGTGEPSRVSGHGSYGNAAPGPSGPSAPPLGESPGYRSHRIPLGPDRGFEPPGPHGPSRLYGFGSYGVRQEPQPRPATQAAEPPAPAAAESRTPSQAEPPAPERAEDAPVDDRPVVDDADDDPDMTIQRPSRDV